MIGLFDSGVGGLSIWREVRRLLPGEDLVYVADSAHVPYGRRPYQEIQAFSMSIARALIEASAELVVVACNTASAAALDLLRGTFPAVPFVGMVPPVKPAAAQSQAKVVGVLATPGTLDGELYARVREEFAPGVEVVNLICQGLVEAVEAGDLFEPSLKGKLAGCLAPLQDQGMDTLVLGCTHYAFLIPLLQEIVRPGTKILDSGLPVAQQVVRVLSERRPVLDALDRGQGQSRFYTSGDPDSFRRRLADLLGLSVPRVGQAEWHDGRLRLLER